MKVIIDMTKDYCYYEFEGSSKEYRQFIQVINWSVPE